MDMLCLGKAGLFCIKGRTQKPHLKKYRQALLTNLNVIAFMH